MPVDIDFPFYYGQTMRGGDSIIESPHVECFRLDKPYVNQSIERSTPISGWSTLDPKGGLFRIDATLLVRLENMTLWLLDTTGNRRPFSFPLSEELHPFLSMHRINKHTFLLGSLHGKILLFHINRPEHTLELTRILSTSFSSQNGTLLLRYAVQKDEASGTVLLYAYASDTSSLEVLTLQESSPHVWRILIKSLLHHPCIRSPILQTIFDAPYFYLLEESGTLYQIHSISKKIECSSWNTGRTIDFIHLAEPGWMWVVYRDPSYVLKDQQHIKLARLSKSSVV